MGFTRPAGTLLPSATFADIWMTVEAGKREDSNNMGCLRSCKTVDGAVAFRSADFSAGTATARIPMTNTIATVRTKNFLGMTPSFKW